MPVVTFSVKQPTTDPVDGALVRVYDSTDSEVGQGYTNSVGELGLLLADGDYLVRYRYDGQPYRVTSPQAFSVSGVDIIVNLELTILDKPTATHPRMCRLYGNFKHPGGSHELTPVRLVSPVAHVYEDDVFLGAAVDLLPDKNGYVEQDVLRGRQYLLVYGRFSDRDEYVSIPDRASARISDVLYPYPVAIAPTSLALVVGDTYVVRDLTLTMTDGTEGSAAQPTMSFDSSDQAVVTADNRTIHAVATGTATVSVTFEDDFHVPISVGDIAVTVT